MEKEILKFIDKEKVIDVNSKMEMVPANKLIEKIEDVFAFEKSAQEDFRDWWIENGEETLKDCVFESIESFVKIQKIDKVSELYLAIDDMGESIVESVRRGVLNVLNTREL